MPSEIEDRDERHEDPFYILAPSALADDRALVLKQGDTFIVCDRHGEIRPVGLAKQGLYHEGTRYLSRLSLRLGAERPLLLSSAVKDDNALIVVDLTNVDVSDGDVITVPRGSLHLSRVLVLWDGTLHEKLNVKNYGLTAISVSLILSFDADYADIFEIRGIRRAKRGERLPATLNGNEVVLGYHGLDDVIRSTTISIDPKPARIAAREAQIDLLLPPQGETALSVQVICESDKRRRRMTFPQALKSASDRLASGRADEAHITTANERFNDWIDRSAADLSMMITDTPRGRYPYAGVPWFSTPFGRDGLITALECLWMHPSLARGVLSYLAATQATDLDPDRDAQPGKILHETRSGEMATLGEIPFGRYYGSHDATPLFVVLASAYYRRTCDLDFIASIWTSIEAALHWIEEYGDLDGDGFIEYARQSPTGLVQQGWKDSHDSVFHSDGELAGAPIALCEVQGYVYAAWYGAAELAKALERGDEGARWSERAERLRMAFEQAFWVDALGTYALALDGAKRRCAVRTSNAGQLLYTGIVSQERARRVADTLLDHQGFSGWGIRTVAAGEVRYNPMSYHNGSIWPHDNAIIAAGFARYGFRDDVLRVLDGLFEASLFIDLHRLPELFCGFQRRQGESPTLYPVACTPQSWAAGSVFMLLQAALGLDIDATKGLVQFRRAKLPAFLEDMEIRNLAVGPTRLDVRIERHAEDVGISVLRREGDVEVVSIK